MKVNCSSADNGSKVTGDSERWNDGHINVVSSGPSNSMANYPTIDSSRDKDYIRWMAKFNNGSRRSVMASTPTTPTIYCTRMMLIFILRQWNDCDPTRKKKKFAVNVVQVTNCFRRISLNSFGKVGWSARKIISHESSLPFGTFTTLEFLLTISLLLLKDLSLML